MRKNKWSWFAACLILAGLLGVSNSVYAEYNEPWGVGFSIGWPQPAGKTKEFMGPGFGIGLHGTWQKEDSFLGVRLDGLYSGHNLTNQVVNGITFSQDGYINIWGIAASLMLTPRGAEKFKPHIYAGPGYFYQIAETYRYGATAGWVCDPWWGCYPVSTTTEVAHKSRASFGLLAGAGLEICFERYGSLVLDVQYIAIDNEGGNDNTEFVPLNIGYKWRF